MIKNGRPGASDIILNVSGESTYITFKAEFSKSHATYFYPERALGDKITVSRLTSNCWFLKASNHGISRLTKLLLLLSSSMLCVFISPSKGGLISPCLGLFPGIWEAKLAVQCEKMVLFGRSWSSRVSFRLWKCVNQVCLCFWSSIVNFSFFGQKTGKILETRNVGVLTWAEGLAGSGI